MCFVDDAAKDIRIPVISAMPSAFKAGRLDRAWRGYFLILPSCITTCTWLLISGGVRGDQLDKEVYKQEGTP